MKRSDFKKLKEISELAIKATELGVDSFEAMICATIDTYADANDIKSLELIAGILGRFMAVHDDEDEDNE